MIELTKPVKRKLRELVHKAHEAALRRELPELIRHVESWPVKKIYKAFTCANTQLPMEGGYGVASGLLDEQSVPEEVRPQIAGAAVFCRGDF